MKWLPIPSTKIYESLGAVADGRVEVVTPNSAKVYSSTRNKFYYVMYDPAKQAIMSNDNASYWKETLGYPAVAFLMKIGVVSYDQGMCDLLKAVPWKDINQKFKNDFEKALAYILSSKTEEQRSALSNFVEKVLGEVNALNLDMLGEKTKPPAGY